MFRSGLSMLLLLLIGFTGVSVKGMSQTADFTYQFTGNAICSPVTVQFKQSCSGSPIGFIWSINSKKYYESNPSVNFISAGAYDISLTAVYEQTSASVKQNIVVNPGVKVNINYDRNFLCQPGVINFSAATNVPIETYTWDFGDNTSPIEVTTADVIHDFKNFGTFNVVVTAKAATGCTNLAKAVIKVQPIVVKPQIDRLSGCIPVNVRFTAIAAVPVNSVVASYEWHFGDTSQALITNAGIVTKTYKDTGVYAPSVTLTTTEGCSASTNFDMVRFGTPPTGITAYAVKPVICASEKAAFVVHATGANNYEWRFGDGVILSKPDTLILHKYSSLGIKNVEVTPIFNGCRGKSAKFSIKVIGVIAGFSHANTCSDKKSYTFNSNSQGNVTETTWSFGSLFPTVSAVKNITKTFPDKGAFSVQLDVSDSISGCKDSIAKLVYTANPSLVTNDSFFCKNAVADFNILDNYSAKLISYSWHIFGKVYSDKSSTKNVKAITPGKYTNFVVIQYDTLACPDTIYAPNTVSVRGPLLNFGLSNICLGDTISIKNNSIPFNASDTINLWIWQLSNKMVDDTIFEPQPFIPSTAGSYKAKLFASDVNGCSDSLVKIFSVTRQPFLHIQNNVDTVCLGQPENIIAFHSDSISWSPVGIMACNNCDTVVFNPAQSMQVYATATSKFNCISKDSMRIKVYAPFTATVPIDNFYICQKETVLLDVSPSNNKVVWLPATGLTNNLVYKPTASPISPTVYVATLTDSANCFSSSASINVNVKTQPTVNAGPDAGYPYNSSFMFSPVYSNNIATYRWNPFDNLSCGDCAVPSGTVLETKTYSVTVVSDSGCVASDTVQIGVQCKDASMFMATAFTPNRDNLNDYYYPLVKGIRMVKNFTIFNRYGQVIFNVKNFAANNKAFGWNGTYKGNPQPASTYFYVLDAVCDLGETIQKNGSFELIR